MTQANQKTAKKIVDKNGKHTTVYVNDDSAASSPKIIPNVIIPTAPSKIEAAFELPENPPARAKRAIQEDTGKMDWDGKPIDYTIFKAGGNSWVWRVAPVGYSGVTCPSCHSFFTDKELGLETPRVNCAICETPTYIGGYVTAVRYDDLSLFDKQEVYDRDWYHITLKSDWSEAITEAHPRDQPYVHLGSLASAKHRMQILISQSKGRLSEDDFYCYEVFIKPDAAIADRVVGDDDSEAPKSAGNRHYQLTEGLGDQTHFYEEFGVTRYVNSYESQGAISLSTHPSSIVISDRSRGFEIKSME